MLLALPQELLEHVVACLHPPFAARVLPAVCRRTAALVPRGSLRTCVAKRRVVCDLDYLAWVAREDLSRRFRDAHGGNFASFALDARVCYTVMVWTEPRFHTRPGVRAPRGDAPKGKRWDYARGGWVPFA